MPALDCCYFEVNTKENSAEKQKQKYETISRIYEALKAQDPEISRGRVESFSYAPPKVMSQEKAKTGQMDSIDAYIRYYYVLPKRQFILVIDSLLDLSYYPASALGLLKAWRKLGVMVHCVVTSYDPVADIWPYFDALYDLYRVSGTNFWGRASKPKVESRPMSNDVRKIYTDLVSKDGYSIRTVANYFGISRSTLGYYVSQSDWYVDRKEPGLNVVHGQEPPEFLEAVKAIGDHYAALVKRLRIYSDKYVLAKFEEK